MFIDGIFLCTSALVMLIICSPAFHCYYATKPNAQAFSVVFVSIGCKSWAA